MNRGTELRAVWYVVVILGCVPPALAETTGRLHWDQRTGCVVETAAVTVWLDHNAQLSAPDLQFLPDGGRQIARPSD